MLNLCSDFIDPTFFFTVIRSHKSEHCSAMGTHSIRRISVFFTAAKQYQYLLALGTCLLIHIEVIRVFVLAFILVPIFISLQLSQILLRGFFVLQLLMMDVFLLQAGLTHTTSTSIHIHCPNSKMVSTRTAATTLTPYQPEVEPENDKMSETNVKPIILKEHFSVQ